MNIYINYDENIVKSVYIHKREKSVAMLILYV